MCGSVTSAEEAIVLAAEANPDLILMDIRLGGKMDGIEAARRIWERLRVPVVFAAERQRSYTGSNRASDGAPGFTKNRPNTDQGGLGFALPTSETNPVRDEEACHLLL
ncbi:MAG: response regulator [Acidobacteriaceae bacterium]|nr:response regulator [Acidobacteriaceae bacterium]